jgi:hypothetical protein
MIEVVLVAYVGSLLALYGAGIAFAVRRSHKDKLLDGWLSQADGRILPVDPRWALESPYAYDVERVFLATGAVLRVRVQGVVSGFDLSFRLVARTGSEGQDLAARLVVEGKGNAPLATALFESPRVKDAVKLVAGAAARFKRVDLYLGGMMICDLEAASASLEHADDAAERLLRFAEVLDDVRPTLGPKLLGAASGKSGAPATFSIELR